MHISEFFEIYKTAGAYSLEIYYYLSQIQRKTMVLLLIVRHSSLESGQQARIVQIDFSAAFDRVNYQGILYKLCSVSTVTLDLQHT